LTALRKLIPPLSVQRWLRACFRYLIIKVWTARYQELLFLPKNFILCDTKFSDEHFVYVSLQACYGGLSIYAYAYIAENINPLLVYIYSGTKIMQRAKHKRGIHSPCINLACDT